MSQNDDVAMPVSLLVKQRIQNGWPRQERPSSELIDSFQDEIEWLEGHVALEQASAADT